MPTRNLTNNENYQSLIGWLNENLIIGNSFVPHLDPIPDVNSKGIYFGFMRTEGYDALGNYVRILPIELKYTKDFDGINYDLVYLGTAGTGKKGNSNLTQRFEWHLNQKHNLKNIFHGTLSTLRTGLGALLSNDLILPNTAVIVNIFMQNYLKLIWIEYPDNKELIDNDETILIKGIRPLLNIKNNPNARANVLDNFTKKYKLRRNQIVGNTKERLELNTKTKI